MASRRLQEREEFFKGLYGLDDMSGSDEERTAHTQGAAFKVPWPPHRPPRRDRDGDLSTPRPTPSLRKAATTASVLSPLPTPPDTSQITAPDTSKRKGLKRATPDTTNGKPAKQKMTSKAKDPPLQPKQFFAGLRFFFIPNRGVATLRKNQITRAEQHGAVNVHPFDDRVTHIVTDSKWELDHILKELPNGRRPSGIPMISEIWLVDCFQNQTLRDYDQPRFFIRGTLPLVDANKGSQRRAKNTSKAASTVSPRKLARHVATDLATTPSRNTQLFELELQTPRRKEDTSDLAAEEHQPGAAPDELDDLLKEMKDSNNGLVEDLITSDPSFKFEGDYDFDSHVKSQTVSSFTCANKNERGHEQSNANYATIQLLKQMATVYDDINDQWRARAFKRAATTLGREQNLIATKDRAKKLPNIGDSIAEKIEEIVLKGSLGRLEEAMADPRVRTLHLFMGIYGVGHKQASEWVESGFTTLEQLAERATLTNNQKIGLDHYQEFQTRIPREAVTQHGDIVGQALKDIDPHLKMIVGGSYRRGSPDSGDIDILITKEFADMGQIRTAVQASLIPQLKAQGFIVAELASGHHGSKDESSKWMGACVLPGSSVWRRLDLLFVPWAEMGAALIYWTGNDFFNRSLRLLASRRKMRLNQHGLYKNVLRGKGRVKLTEGELVESHSEKKIFECLGVAYRPPHHRLA